MDGSALVNLQVLTNSLVQFGASALLLAQSSVTGVEGGDVPVADPSLWQTLEPYGYAAMFILGIFVVPFVISHFITAAIRMPSHSFRLGLMLAAITGGLMFGFAKDFQLTYGPDMKGGTTLVYDIVEDENGKKLDSGALATALSQRLNPSGTKEISIRPRGDSQIEITVPMVDELELERLKNRLTTSGVLQFRIVANTRDHANIKELAVQQAAKNSGPVRDVTDAKGEVVGRWYRVQRAADKVDGVYPLKTPVYNNIIRNSFTGGILNTPQLNFDDKFAYEKWLAQQGVREVDMLMSFERAGKPYAVVAGDDLAAAATEFDKIGQPVVAFRLTGTGAQKMLRMTAANTPDGEFHREMAIIMDDQVISAPQLNSPIRDNGQITGNFTKAEIDFLVNILRSGRLPATLSDEPASEDRVGAGLGATTISKGTTASIAAVIATFVTILAYYRFAGVVASVALIINGILIFGVMIFIGQPLTLPGLAGLVLTVGMSVDANVLIFERIREEKNKGSATRMSIRNGFDRAFSTIVDSNLTTLIAAIVLYWIGTDQVRGFAVALIIGLMTSMFTATFCSRIIFEICEKLKIVNLSMSDGVGFIKKMFIGDRDIDFMSMRFVCAVFSSVLIVLGLVATYFRGTEILNIDFMGGTSVTLRLSKPVTADALRTKAEAILDEDEEGRPVQFSLVKVEKEPADTVYTLVTSIGSREFLSKKLVAGFNKDDTADLVTYRVKIQKDASAEPTSHIAPPSVGRLVWTQATEPTPAVAPQSEGAATPVTSSTEEASKQEPAIEVPGSEAGVATEPTTAPASVVEDPQTLVPDSAVAPTGDSDAASAAVGNPLSLGSEVEPEQTVFVLEVGGSNDDNPAMPKPERGAKIDGPTLRAQLLAAGEAAGFKMSEPLVDVVPVPQPKDWEPTDVSGHSQWRVSLPVGDAAAAAIIERLEAEMKSQPLWLSLSQIGSKVAGEMQQRAVAAILISLVFIVGYIWFRFQKISYGLAAVVALVHDVLITLGLIALCHWLAKPLGFLMIDDFKIGLTEVAAFLTIIGYSLNDTIVVFDRIREVRGRSPKLDAKMINASINQTLSRTLLTSGTTLLTVLLLYIFGGEGIHTFAFALLVGIIVGTYSSIFVAAPLLLWFSSREKVTGRPGTIG